MTSDYDYDYAPPRRPKRRPVRKLLAVLAALLAVAIVIGGSYVFYLANVFDNNSQKIEHAFPENRVSKAAGDGSKNILLMGTDADGGSGEGENLAGVPNGGRTDTMMLVHVPENRDKVYVMSIMRDTWTTIPGYGEHKINSAMAFGGTPLVVETVETLFNARIDHVASVDFAGFRSLTDALGGVEIDNPAAFQITGGNGESFPEGVQSLDGESALNFVRERKSFTNGDYQRVANQQLFVKALVSEILSPATLANPLRMSGVVSEFSPYISVDSEFSGPAAAFLGASLWKVRGNDIEMFTLPSLGTGMSADGQSIVLKDEAAIAEISEAMSNGSVADYLASTG
jgi:LCP family protein required for cell wall assembly